MQRYKKDFNLIWNYMEKWVHLTQESPADEWKECIDEGKSIFENAEHREFLQGVVYEIQKQIGRQ